MQFLKKDTKWAFMTDATLLELKKMPAILMLYKKAIFAKGAGYKQDKPLPTIEVNIRGVKLNKSNISSYARICGYRFNQKTLPLTYPHVLAFKLHMELMVNKAFPFPLLGLVHIRNEVSAHRAIELSESLSIKVFLSDATITAKGIEFDLVSQVFSQENIVWESTSTYFHRQKSIQPPVKSTPTPPRSKYRYSQVWSLPEYLGREYAKVSGDSNPIHLHALSTKFFGFKRAIAHGMWSKAHAIAALQPLLKSDQMKVIVDFKLPIYLPGKAVMHYQEHVQGAQFELRDASGKKPYMSGEITLL
jgi:hypothetical protein